MRLVHILSVVLVVVVSVVDANEFERMMRNNAKCPPFTCPSSSSSDEKLSPVPKRGTVHQFTSTGCSSGNMGGIFMGSANTGSATQDLYLGECCDQRNACVTICGASKAACESTFKTCASDACDALEADGALEAEADCRKDANMLSIMSTLQGGCGDFNAQQAANCECVTKQTATKRRHKLLTRFYETNADPLLLSGERLEEKVAGLVEKADTPRKFASLLHRLVGKYPDAVRRVKDPQQEMFERAFAEAEAASASSSAAKEEEGEEGDVIDMDDDDDEAAAEGSENVPHGGAEL